jgi:hypothetical protein
MLKYTTQFLYPNVWVPVPGSVIFQLLVSPPQHLIIKKYVLIHMHINYVIQKVNLINKNEGWNSEIFKYL